MVFESKVQDTHHESDFFNFTVFCFKTNWNNLQQFAAVLTLIPESLLQHLVTHEKERKKVVNSVTPFFTIIVSTLMFLLFLRPFFVSFLNELVFILL
jgi:hypothetical protein